MDEKDIYGFCQECGDECEQPEMHYNQRKRSVSRDDLYPLPSRAPFSPAALVSLALAGICMVIGLLTIIGWVWPA